MVAVRDVLQLPLVDVPADSSYWLTHSLPQLLPKRHDDVYGRETRKTEEGIESGEELAGRGK